MQKDADFVKNNLNDICASYQHHLIKVLLKNTRIAIEQQQVKHLAIAGGVSANSELRSQVAALGKELGIQTYIPKFEYCTDNAAMIGITAVYKCKKNQFADLRLVPATTMNL